MIKFESLFKNILYNLQFLYRDINAANNILKRGLESFGLGIRAWIRVVWVRN